MDNLRLWILLIGIACIAGVYGYGKYQERRERRLREQGDAHPAAAVSVTEEADAWDVGSLRARRHGVTETELAAVAKPGAPAPAREVSAAAVAASVSSAPEPEPEPVPAAPARRAAPGGELILTMGVVAPQGKRFNGSDLAALFPKAGLVYGPMQIFHSPVDPEDPEGEALFSIANMVEPGTLEPERLTYLSTPGLYLFARLPGYARGIDVYEHMLAVADFLAESLDGEICDEKRRPLTKEHIAQVRERICDVVGDAVLELEG